MEVVRIGAISPPKENRSQWARACLAEALDLQLKPVAVPAHKVESFTSTMPPVLAAQIKEMAQASGLSIASLTAGLFEALSRHSQGELEVPKPASPVPGIPGQEHVRDVLLPLLEQSVVGIESGKVVFAEAATGTGKGRMIAALAAHAATKGDTVVISAPLAVTWQLLEALKVIPEAQVAGITMSLGRPNFVSPSRLMEWALEQERDNLVDWIGKGGKPLSARTAGASGILEQELCWMLEDALALAEDLPVDAIMLSPDDSDECPAQRLYQSMRGNHTGAAIILCSHYMLASHIRFLQLRGGADEAEDSGQDTAMGLPPFIDTLIVDEAHLLEQAFAAIYSHSLRLKPLIRAVESKIGRGRGQALNALNALAGEITRSVIDDKGNGSRVCRLEEIPSVEQALKDALSALEGLSTRSLDEATKATVRSSVRTMKDALSGRSRLRLELTPVRHFPMLVSGRANLQNALLCLWDSVAGAALLSATLYASDDKAFLIRWKLEVPPTRAKYLPPVHPTWMIDPVVLQRARNTLEADDTPEWADETAGIISQVAANAAGGVLVLCTSHQNVEMLHSRLIESLAGRLVVQTRKNSASLCVSQYKDIYRAGLKPVWLGLGAAWTGIDLSDELAADPVEDHMLSDLVITRLPVGLNRSLTHDRRVAIAGFKIVTLEAIWHLRQGLGRLVRRPGVGKKNLWVLDSRLDTGSSWISPYKKLLSRYRSADS
ncbi:helicase C-terminal domain-containing protein [Pseudomonas aeruginosa]|nr:hypothetical protein [Pseudomonas aeruginosa]